MNPSPIRIAMLSYHTCPLATLGGKDTGGMNVYVRDLSRQLGKSGIGVDVFTRSQDEHVPHVLHDLGYGNRIVHIKAGPEVPMNKTALSGYIDDFVDGIVEFTSAKDLNYDLIHSHYWLSGLAGLKLRKIWKIPLIQMFHTLAVMKNRVARSPDEVASETRLEVESRLLQESQKVVAATEAELAQIRWLYRVDTDNVIVIPPGVDTARFYPIPKDEAKEFIGIHPEGRMLLFVGRIEPLKGIDTLFQAVSLLKQHGVMDKNPFYVAIIGGDPDATPDKISNEMGRLKQLRQELGIEDLVAFLGKRDQDTLPYYYSAAEAVIVPSHYESFGLVALEAMACGTPVVASETGGLAFLIKDGETGFHVPAADPEALCETLERVLVDVNLRERLGDQAAAYAKAYDWDIIADRLIALYRQEISKASSSAG
ncbi:MAG: glycosyltransferase [Anaerolineales bacterium]